MTPISHIFKAKRLKFLLKTSLILFFFSFSTFTFFGCEDDEEPCDLSSFNCAPGYGSKINCNCICPPGYRSVLKNCERKFGSSLLTANIEGAGINGIQTYATEEVDFHFSHDTLTFDGYIEADSSYIYVRYVTGDGSAIKKGTYPLTPGFNDIHASMRYKSGGENAIFTLTTGSLEITGYDGFDVITANFSFDAQDSTGQIRKVTNGYVTSH